MHIVSFVHVEAAPQCGTFVFVAHCNCADIILTRLRRSAVERDVILPKIGAVFAVIDLGLTPIRVLKDEVLVLSKLVTSGVIDRCAQLDGVTRSLVTPWRKLDAAIAQVFRIDDAEAYVVSRAGIRITSCDCTNVILPGSGWSLIELDIAPFGIRATLAVINLNLAFVVVSKGEILALNKLDVGSVPYRSVQHNGITSSSIPPVLKVKRSVRQIVAVHNAIRNAVLAAIVTPALIDGVIRANLNGLVGKLLARIVVFPAYEFIVDAWCKRLK